MAPSITRLYTSAPTVPHGWETVEDLVSRCRAAARLALRGQGYTPEDRSEAAAHIAARIIAETPARSVAASCRRCQGAASRWAILDSGVPGITARVPLCVPCSAPALSWRPILHGADALPAVPFSRLSGMAANRRRSVDAQRERDKTEAGQRAASEAYTPKIMEDPSPLVLSAQAAHRAALSALDTLGCRPLRKGDAPLYTAAYRAARLSSLELLTDDRSDERAAAEAVAAELALSYGTMRQHVNRAPSRVPSLAKNAPHGWEDHLEAATLLDTGGVALKPSRSRTLSSDLDTDWRTSQPTEAQVTKRKRPGRRSDERTRALVLNRGTAQERRVHIPAHAPQWAEELHRSNPASAARLHRAAEIRRERKRTSELAAREPMGYERGDGRAVR